MKVQMAHLRDQGIDFAIFDANARSNLDSDRATLLHDLVSSARGAGLKVDKAALTFRQGNGTRFYGTPDLVQYLRANGVPRWTHTINV
jgi:hypothetical protein